MTTMTLTIDDEKPDLVEAFKIFASNFKGVSFQVQTEETKEEVLESLSNALKEIKSGNAIKNARPIEDLFKEFAND